MYRYYKALPEFNRVCIKASRDRAYQQHMDALKRMRPSVDTRQPDIPQTIGRNYKRYENEQQRNMVITRDNKRLVNKMDTIMKEEHYPRAVPQRPFTLQGQAQKDEMWRITHENHKLLTAVQEKKPTLNRNDWLLHKIDHEYQVNKMSELKPTLPMSEVLRREKLNTSQKGLSTKGSTRASSKAPSMGGNSKAASSGSSARGILEEETKKKAETLFGDVSDDENTTQPSNPEPVEKGSAPSEEDKKEEEDQKN